VAGAALDTTALVHESYLRLVKADKLNLESRRHFMAYAAHVMRCAVVDFVRQARARRRGGDQLQVTLTSCWRECVRTARRMSSACGRSTQSCK
jgi:DNA-directed RNA polymerase specialized sigma24 family protein